MELKHFSHAHNLTPHHVPRGSEIQCSACHTPGSGDVYACWQCHYFLHQICFTAKRSLKHPAHPLHPLTLVPSPTYPSGSFICNSCSLDGHGLSYSCSECEFDVHIHCLLSPILHAPSPSLVPAPHNSNSQPQIPIYPPPQTSISSSVPNNHIYPQPNISTPTPQPTPVIRTNEPKSETSTTKHFSHPHFLKPNEIKQNKGKLDCSACESDLTGSAYTCTEPHCNFNLHKDCFDLPREVRHKFHPHPLTLLPVPTYTGGFTCNACWRDGQAFVYNCAACSFDLHVDCVQLPETVSRLDHEHPLSLSTLSSEGFKCDVCMNLMNEKGWVYYCTECDFGTHLECVHSEVQKRNESGHEEDMEGITDQLLRMHHQQQQNHIRIQMLQQNDMFNARQNALFMQRMNNPWRVYY